MMIKAPSAVALTLVGSPRISELSAIPVLSLFKSQDQLTHDLAAVAHDDTLRLLAVLPCFAQFRMPKRKRVRCDDNKAQCSPPAGQGEFQHVGMTSTIPVEVLARILDWTTAEHWLLVRSLSRKWRAAAECMMEVRLTRALSSGVLQLGPNSPQRRLLLISVPFMALEVRQSVVAVDMSVCQRVDPLELELIGRHFSELGKLVCPATFTDEGLCKLSFMPGLTSLQLPRCSWLTDFGVSEIGNLSRLTCLGLSNGEMISDEGVADLAKLSQLTNLALPSCQSITDIGAGRIASLTNLKSLNLSCCVKLTDNGVKELSRLAWLRVLNCAGCIEITDCGVQQIANLAALTSLNLSGCYRITDRGMNDISKLRSLAFLALLGCEKITDASIEAVVAIPTLKTIHVVGCKALTQTTVQEMAAKRGLRLFV
jgi:hypothetical protein